MRLPNIAQVEFIRSKERESLAMLRMECVDRMFDGADIKTVLRLYDDNTLTSLAEAFEEVSNQLGYIHDNFQHSSWLVRKYYNWQSKRLAGRELELRSQARDSAASKISEALYHKQPVAIDYDYRKDLRWVRDDEAHELAEAALMSSVVQIFIFEHNDLLSNHCKVIAQIY